MKKNFLLLSLIIGFYAVSNAQTVSLSSSTSTSSKTSTSTSVANAGNTAAFSYAVTFKKSLWNKINTIIQKEYPKFNRQTLTEKNDDFEYKIELQKTGLKLGYKSRNQSADNNKNQNKLESIADQVNLLKE